MRLMNVDYKQKEITKDDFEFFMTLTIEEPKKLISDIKSPRVGVNCLQVEY